MDHNTAVQGYKEYLVSGNPAFLPQSMEKNAAAMHDQEVGAYKNYFMSKEARAGHPANIALARMVRPGMLPGMDDPSRQGSIRQPGEQHTIQSYMDNLMQQSPTAQAFRPGPHYDDLHQKSAAKGDTAEAARDYAIGGTGGMVAGVMGSHLIDVLRGKGDEPASKNRKILAALLGATAGTGIAGTYRAYHGKTAGARARLTGGLPDKLNAAGRLPPVAEGLPETPGGISEDGIQSSPATAVQTPTETLAKTAGIKWWDLV